MALTVIEPAVETKLTTLETVWDALAISPGAADTFLDLSIDQASDAICTWCGRTFALETVRETIYSRSFSDGIMLSRWPVVSVISVSMAGADQDVGLIESEDGGFLHRVDANGARRGWGIGNAVVEYQAGYLLPGTAGRTLPHDIERAAILLVRAAYFSRDRDPSVRTETVEGVGSTSYGLDSGFTLPPEVEGLLSRHRAASVL